MHFPVQKSHLLSVWVPNGIEPDLQDLPQWFNCRMWLDCGQNHVEDEVEYTVDLAYDPAQLRF